MRQFPLRHLLIAAAVVAVVLPASSLAGLFLQFGIGGPCGGCGFSFAACLCPPCFACHYPAPACVCPPPPVYHTGFQPVLQTQYRTEQFVTYQQVPRTEIRREAYVERVPVTTFEQVTETVYVPQQVTRSVPRTVMTEQTRYRDVPYQVVERVPQVQTRLVPRQPIGYAPALSPLSDCATCGAPGWGAVPTAPASYHGALPAAATPIPSAIPTMPPISVSPYAAPTAVPQYDDASWTNVRPRSEPTPAPSYSPRGASLFRPAPSAATVWQSRF